MSGKSHMKRRNSKQKSNRKILLWTFAALISVAVIVFLTVNGYFADAYGNLMGRTAENTAKNVTTGASYGVIDGAVNVKIHFVSVGQGDAAVIELPNNEYMLIDAGSTSSGFDSIEKYYSGYLDDVVDGDEIDYMVATHPDADHYNMLSDVLADYKVGNIYYNYYADASKSYKTFMTNAENEGANLFMIDTDDDSTMTFSAGSCSVSLYSCGNDGISGENATISNSMSIMCLLAFGGRKILFAGDATAGKEKWFIGYTSPADMDVDFLKVAHHGSKYSSTEEFLGYVKPEYAVISVGEGNSYGHPSQDALARLSAVNAVVYRTDTDGTITLVIDDDGDYAFSFDTGTYASQ
jgi:beta-lactamase superfamily II metal-dependent hydrolase